MQASGRLIIFRVIGKERSCVQQSHKSCGITGLKHFLAGLPVVFRRGVSDLPVVQFGTSHAKNRVQHVLLADCEGGNVHGLVLEVNKGGTLVVFVIGQDFETEQRGHCATNLRHGGGIDLCLSIVHDHQRPVVEVKSVPVWTASETKLVPKAACKPNVVALAKSFDLVAKWHFHCTDYTVFALYHVIRVPSKLVWQYPGHSSHCGGVNEFSLCVWRGHVVHRDDQDVLAFECLDKGSLVVVINLDHGHAVGKSIVAILTSDGCDSVLAGLQKSLRYVLANSSSCLI